ncbi:MAG: MarC family protein [Pseudomonadota bacterium]
MLDLFDTQVFLKFAAALVAVLNPLYGIPIFLSMTKDNSAAERRRIATIVGLTIFVAATICTVIGEEILSFFGITVSAFQIAGGIIILGIGLSMLRADEPSTGDQKAQSNAENQQSNIAIVPLTIPLILGPASIATIILFAHLLDDGQEIVTMLPIVALISIAIWLGLMFAEPISRVLGETTMSVVTRIMALLLTAIAVEMVINGAFQAYEHRHVATGG